MRKGATITKGGSLSRRCRSRMRRSRKSKRRLSQGRRSAGSLRERMLHSRTLSERSRSAPLTPMFINKLIEELRKFSKRRIIVRMFQELPKMKMRFHTHIKVESPRLRIRFLLFQTTAREDTWLEIKSKKERALSMIMSITTIQLKL